MAANTMAKSAEPSCVGHFRLADDLGGQLIVPHTRSGKIGSFCPRISVIIQSMEDTPV